MKTNQAKTKSEILAKEAVDYMMKHYPITMEKLRLEEEKELKEREQKEAAAKQVYDEVMEKYPNLMEKLKNS
jgi:hypothetical protein